MTEDRSVLSVLESLTASADLPQRSIAAKTGLNLAKVNFVLRKLIDKGFVKLHRVRQNPDKLRYLYLLTPEGLAEKSRLTYRFLRRTLQEYDQVEERIQESVRSMIAIGIRRVALWGETEITRLCQRVLQHFDHQVIVVGIVDPAGINPQCIHPGQLPGLSVDAVVVCADEHPELPAGIKVWRLV